MGIYINFGAAFIKLTYWTFLLLLPALVLYTSCDGYRSNTIKISSQSCSNSAQLSLKLLKFDPNIDCDQTQKLVCEHRNFRPEIVDQVYQTEECLATSEFGELCLSVTNLDFNTESASDDPTQFEEGAAYNYEEYNCYYQGLSHNEKPIFSSTDSTLHGSLNRLYSACRQGGDE